jgi:predicted TIM-barrel fold metal-dependent hydrolase
MHVSRAADCHAHVFCRSRFGYAPDATYEPHPSQAGTVARFLAVLEAHGLSHGLLVGPEPHGTDNRCLLEGLAAGNGRLKGIALVQPDVAERDLRALADCGVVGIRFNLSTFGMAQFGHPAAERLLARLEEMGWFLQIHCEKDELALAAPILRRAGVRVIVDHFGRPNVARGLDQPGVQTLLELGRSGNAVVKLSGAFRSSRAGWPYRDVEPFIAAAIEAFTPGRCVWGSDWPFVRTDERIDYGPELACLQRWLPDEADRQKVLWDTPARLFGSG